MVNGINIAPSKDSEQIILEKLSLLGGFAFLIFLACVLVVLFNFYFILIIPPVAIIFLTVSIISFAKVNRLNKNREDLGLPDTTYKLSTINFIREIIFFINCLVVFVLFISLFSVGPFRGELLKQSNLIYNSTLRSSENPERFDEAELLMKEKQKEIIGDQYLTIKKELAVAITLIFVFRLFRSYKKYGSFNSTLMFFIAYMGILPPFVFLSLKFLKVFLG